MSLDDASLMPSRRYIGMGSRASHQPIRCPVLGRIRPRTATLLQPPNPEHERRGIHRLGAGFVSELFPRYSIHPDRGRVRRARFGRSDVLRSRRSGPTGRGLVLAGAAGEEDQVLVELEPDAVVAVDSGRGDIGVISVSDQARGALQAL